MAKKDFKERDARQCINDIFINPPVSRADLESRLRKVDATTVRRLLVDELEKGKLSEDESFMFVEVMSQLGPGGQKKRLLKIASDSNRDKKERAYAFMGLGHGTVEDGDSVLAEIGDEVVDEMMRFSLRNLFMLDETRIGYAVVNILEGLPLADFAAHFWPILDEQRTQARVPAYIAYADALKEDSLSELHPTMISAIEQEGHSQGITLLQKLGSQSTDRSTQKGFHKAALKARTKMASPGPTKQQQKGFALVSSCDGQGAVSVIACLQNKDGSSSLAILCVRAEREVRDGFYLPSVSQKEFDDLIVQQQLGANIGFVEVSLEEAATIVHSALEQHTKNDAPLDLDAQRAIACFPHSSDTLQSDLHDEELLSKVFSVADYEEMLDCPEYDSWFFDSADFDQCGVTPPDEFDFDTCQDEIDAAARKLDDPVIKERLLAMNRYMAWWCYKDDDEESSAMHLQAIKSISDDFINSAFVKAMVAQSFFVANMQKGLEAEESLFLVGDPNLRRLLRSLFFADIEVPTGKHVAALDFTEAAHLAFEDLFEKLPGDKRPRPNLLPIVSYKVGRVLAESLQKKLHGTPEQIIAKAALAIKRTTGLDESQSNQLATMAVATLFDFTETVCTQCTVACLHHPRQRMPEVFFSDKHPGAL